MTSKDYEAYRQRHTSSNNYSQEGNFRINLTPDEMKHLFLNHGEYQAGRSSCSLGKKCAIAWWVLALFVNEERDFKVNTIRVVWRPEWREVALSWQEKDGESYSSYHSVVRPYELAKSLLEANDHYEKPEERKAAWENLGFSQMLTATPLTVEDIAGKREYSKPPDYKRGNRDKNAGKEPQNPDNVEYMKGYTAKTASPVVQHSRARKASPSRKGTRFDLLTA